MFNIKSDSGLDIYLLVSVLGMSKISNNIGFDALLVFVHHQTPSFTVRGCFCPIDFHYNHIFGLQSQCSVVFFATVPANFSLSLTIEMVSK